MACIDFMAAKVADCKARMLRGEVVKTRPGTALDEALRADPDTVQVDVSWVKRVGQRVIASRGQGAWEDILEAGVQVAAGSASVPSETTLYYYVERVLRMLQTSGRCPDFFDEAKQ